MLSTYDPNVPYAARACIGGLLCLPIERCRAVLAAIDNDDPDDPRLRVILRLVREVVAAGKRPDPIVVWAHAQTSGTIRRDELNGLSTELTRLASVESCPIPLACGDYAASMREGAVRRTVTDTAERLRVVAAESSAETLSVVVRDVLVLLVYEIGRLSVPILLVDAS